MIELISQIVVVAIFVVYVYIVCCGHDVLSRGLLLISVICLCAVCLDLDCKITYLKDQLLIKKE